MKKLLIIASGLLIGGSSFGQIVGANVVTDIPLTTGAEAMDPVAPSENAGLQDITVVADGAASVEDLLAVDGAHVMQQFGVGEGEERVYFARRGDLDPTAPQNVAAFTDPTLPTITFSWDLEFDGDASVWSGLPVIGSGTPERQSWTSGPTERGVEAEGDSFWLTSATAGAENGVGFRFVIEFDKPLTAAGFTLPRAELSGRDVETEAETVWEAAFYDADDNLLSRQTALPGDDADVAALFGYIAAEGEMISKIVIGDIEEWFLSGGGTNRIFFDDLLFALDGTTPPGHVVHDIVLSTGADAMDPVAPSDNAGLQDITVVADGAASKEDLLAVDGALVMQQFGAGEGEERNYFMRRGDLDPDAERNIATFSDPDLPTIIFSWDLEFDGDASVWSGLPLIGSGTPERQSWTSGPTERGVEAEGDGFWLTSATAGAENGVGFRFVIEFTKPLAAAGFTLPRAEESGRDPADPETVWEAAFYDADDNLLSRQTALPGDAADVAALFGYIAAEGETISKIVIGEIEEWFLAGASTDRIFFDDLLFAVDAPPMPHTVLDIVLTTGADAMDPVAPSDNAGLQDITVVADGAASKEALLAVNGAMVMQQFGAGEGEDRNYFMRRGDLDPEAQQNVAAFTDPNMPTITFGWDLEFEGDASVWSGLPLIGSGTPERQSWTSGPTERGVEAEGDGFWLTSATAGAENGVGFKFVIEFDKPLAAAGFTLPRAEESGRDPADPETVWEAAFYDADDNLLSRQTALPGDAADVAALFGYIAAEGETISKIVIGDIEEWYLAGASTDRIFFDDLLFALDGAPPPGHVVYDIVLTTGADAMDPVAPSDNAGLQDITVVADGAASKEDLLAVDGAQVMQQFGAGLGEERNYFMRRGDLDPGAQQNVAMFSDPDLPTITFGWDLEFEGDASVWSGLPLIGSGTPERQSWTSGPTERGVEAEGDGFWLTSATAGAENGVGFRFVIEFDKPLAAAGFTLPRAEESGRDPADPETVWEAAFYDADDNLLSRQTALPGDAADVAALFGYIAGPGEAISKIVIGDIEEWFLAGASTDRIFFDDLLFAVGEGPPAGGNPYWLYGAAGAGSFDVVEGNLVFTTPGSGGYYRSISDLPGITINPGESLVTTQKIIPGAVLGASTNNRFGVFSYAEAPGGKPTGDIPDAPGFDLPGLGATGYQWTFPIGQIRQEDPRSGDVTINMGLRKRRFGLAGEVNDELQGRSGDYITLDLITLVEPTKNFTQDEEHTIEYRVDLLDAETVVVRLLLLDKDGEVMGEWAAFDIGDVYTTFDTFAFRDGQAGSSGSPVTILEDTTEIGVPKDPPPFPEVLPWQEPDVVVGEEFVHPWFGPFVLSTDGWLRHSELGWLYTDVVETADNMWLYGLYLDGWLWSNDMIFPICYDINNTRYVYYFINADTGDVWLYDYSTGLWSLNP